MPSFSILNAFDWLFPGLAIALFSLLVPCSLAEAGAGDFVITSNRLEMDGKRHVAVFWGAVRAKEQKMRLASDKMIVHYYRTEPGSRTKKQRRQSGVTKIRAEGHVVLQQGESQGSAEQMVYRVKEQTLEMLGIKKDASIRHGEDRLTGKKILLTLGSDRSILKISVEGGDRRRVSARFTPPEEEENASRSKKSPRPRGISTKQADRP